MSTSKTERKEQWLGLQFRMKWELQEFLGIVEFNRKFLIFCAVELRIFFKHFKNETRNYIPHSGWNCGNGLDEINSNKWTRSISHFSRVGKWTSPLPLVVSHYFLWLFECVIKSEPVQANVNTLSTMTADRIYEPSCLEAKGICMIMVSANKR